MTIILDLFHHTLRFLINGEDKGIAFDNVNAYCYLPAVCLCRTGDRVVYIPSPQIKPPKESSLQPNKLYLGANMSKEDQIKALKNLDFDYTDVSKIVQCTDEFSLSLSQLMNNDLSRIISEASEKSENDDTESKKWMMNSLDLAKSKLKGKSRGTYAIVRDATSLDLLWSTGSISQTTASIHAEIQNDNIFTLGCPKLSWNCNLSNEDGGGCAVLVNQIVATPGHIRRWGVFSNKQSKQVRFQIWRVNLKEGEVLPDDEKERDSLLTSKNQFTLVYQSGLFSTTLTAGYEHWDLDPVYVNVGDLIGYSYETEDPVGALSASSTQSCVANIVKGDPSRVDISGVVTTESTRKISSVRVFIESEIPLGYSKKKK